MEAKTCDEAKANLLEQLGPIHETDWGCLYSEVKQGWFRPECTVTLTTVERAQAAAYNVWATTGGAFLIIFIIAMSLFFLWWMSGCYRTGGFIWFWKINQELDYGRITYRRQTNNTGMKKLGQDDPFAIDSINDDNDVDDIYLNRDNDN